MATTEIAVPDIGDYQDVPVIEVHVAPGDVVAEEDPLVTLESDKATMDVLVVTDVRDRDLCGCHCCLRSTQVWGGPGQLRAGLGFSGSMSYLAIALATVSAGTVPSWARAASAATATKCRSTSKNWRSLRR